MNAPIVRDRPVRPGPPLAATRYFDRHFQVDAVKVLPGEYFATAGNLALVTVLGSCVAACLRDAESGVGGMNHFMLAGVEEDGPCGASARYGAFAMELLINHLLKLGARRPALEAKVFGGACVVAGLAQARVGERNAEFIRRYLAAEGIRLAAEDLLGARPRKLVFFPASGRALVKALGRVGDDHLLQQESAYRRQIERGGAAGEVELFG